MFNIFFQRKALKERKGRVMVPLCTCCLRLLAECDVHAHMSICARAFVVGLSTSSAHAIHIHESLAELSFLKKLHHHHNR